MKQNVINSDKILHCESELQHLQEELASSHVTNAARHHLQYQLKAAMEQFKDTVAGRNAWHKMQQAMDAFDLLLAQAVVERAEQIIPKQEHSDAVYQALQHIKQRLVSGKMNGTQARHEVKTIMRKTHKH